MSPGMVNVIRSLPACRNLSVEWTRTIYRVNWTYWAEVVWSHWPPFVWVLLWAIDSLGKFLSRCYPFVEELLGGKKKQWGIHSQQRLEHLLTATSEYVCLVRGRETIKSLNSFVRLQWHHPVGPRVLVHLECVLLCSRTWRFAATQMQLGIPFPGLGKWVTPWHFSRFIHFAMEVGNLNQWCRI